MVKKLAVLLVLLLGAAFLMAGPAAASAYTWQYTMGNIGGTLNAGATVPQSQNWTVESYNIVSGGSCHRTQLRFQRSDANLVNYYAHSDAGLCSPFSAVWATNKTGPSGFTLKFQGNDGHIVVYNGSGQAVWASPYYSTISYGYGYLVRLGTAAWCEYRAPPQGGWTLLWILGPGGQC
jgi:hypothetical protein